MANILMAQEATRSALMGGFLWILAIALAVVVAVILARQIRRSSSTLISQGRPPFTLDEIRRMRDAGELSIAEYESLRAKMIDETMGAEDQA